MIMIFFMEYESKAWDMYLLKYENTKNKFIFLFFEYI